MNINSSVALAFIVVILGRSREAKGITTDLCKTLLSLGRFLVVIS